MDEQGIIRIGEGRDDRLPVESLRCLGPKMKEHLNAIGIVSVGDLKEMGVMDAYLALIKTRIKPNPSYAWALFAALLDVEFHQVPPELKDAFRAELSRIHEKTTI